MKRIRQLVLCIIIAVLSLSSSGCASQKTPVVSGITWLQGRYNCEPNQQQILSMSDEALWLVSVDNTNLGWANIRIFDESGYLRTADVYKIHIHQYESYIYSSLCNVIPLYNEGTQKWGAINRDGEIKIPFIYEGVGRETTSRYEEEPYLPKEAEELFAVYQQNNGRIPVEGERSLDLICGYVDENGKEVIPTQYLGGAGFSEGLAPVYKDGHCSYINIKGEPVIDLELANREATGFSGGRAVIGYYDGDDSTDSGGFRHAANVYAVIDKTGEILYNITEKKEYISERLAGVEVVFDLEDHTARCIDANGNEKSISYAGITLCQAYVFGEHEVLFYGRFETDAGGWHYGYPCSDGKNINVYFAPDLFDSIENQLLSSPFDPFSNASEYVPDKNRQVVRRFNQETKITRFGFVDSKWSVCIPIQYEGAHNFVDGIAPVKKDGKWGAIDSNGKTVIDFQFDCNDLSAFVGGVAVTSNGEVVSRNGEIIYSTDYTLGTPQHFGEKVIIPIYDYDEGDVGFLTCEFK